MLTVCPGHGRRQLQTSSDSGAECTKDNVEERKKAVHEECCDEAGEDCNNIGDMPKRLQAHSYDEMNEGLAR